jgi:hypothetical protein
MEAPFFYVAIATVLPAKLQLSFQARWIYHFR